MQEENNFEQEEINEEHFEQEEEIGFADKAIGVFTSPSETLAAVAKHPPKASNWLIPIILMICVSAISTITMYSSPELTDLIQEQQMEALEKQMDEQVKSGSITAKQAKEYEEMAYENMGGGGSLTIIYGILGSIFGIFILFFIVNLVFFIVIKIMGGQGNYSSVLSAYGSAYYILIAQALIALILTLVLQKLATGVNLYAFMDVDMMSLQGVIFRKLDLFTIWFYYVLGVSFAKFFHSENTTKYVIMTYSVWILGAALMYYISTLSPYLSFFAM